MFVTPQEVMEVTAGAAAIVAANNPTATNPYENITVDDVRMAQFVIETYLGRSETQIDVPSDIMKVRRAVIAQTIYMRDNPDITFNQISVSSISRGDGLTVFRAGDYASPFIAPLALMALGGLSWRRTRSVRVGRLHQKASSEDWRRE